MNDLKIKLQKFINDSSPEELRAELLKGNRPFFQTIGDDEYYPLILIGWGMICLWTGYFYSNIKKICKNLKKFVDSARAKS
jgi:hypothetical protein